MKHYETVIGLEVHVELATKSKIFCGCTTEFGGAPNTHCCPVCCGMPGTLPVLNKKVVEFAIATGIATNCSIRRTCKFDRKNYFYPDLPKAYQISQLYLPICYDGRIEIEVDGVKKVIGIHEIHMEEDAGKLIHDSINDCSYVDYNRSGVPLLEIVSAPDLRSAEEVIAYLEKLKLILEYLGVSDCKMQEGSLRVDLNLSVREEGTEELGTRTEMKNMNSFKAITRAIEGESKRQMEQLERGDTVLQETRRWDDAKNMSFAMRSKEEAKDYRYFPEPDLVPIEITEEWLEMVRKRQPELRDEKMLRYEKEYDIPEYDAGIITGSKTLADLFEVAASLCKKPKEVSNWLMGETMRLINEHEMEIEEIRFTPENLAKLIDLVDQKIITRTVAKDVFEKVFAENIDPDRYVEEHGLKMVKDDGALRETIKEILSKNPQSVIDYKNGKDRVLGFLVGLTMKAMEKKADPVMIQKILKELLSE